MEIAEKCVGETFSLTGDDRVEFFEGVNSFNYLGRILQRTDGDWPEVIQSIGRARQVWGSLGKFPSRDKQTR